MRFIKAVCVFSVAICFSGDLIGQEKGADKKERTRQGRRDGKMRGNLVEMFRKLDKNGDSVLSRDEIPQRLAARFARMDQDGSGAIEAREIRAIVQRLRQSGAGRQDGKRRDGKKGMAEGNRKGKKGNRSSGSSPGQETESAAGRRGGAMSMERMLRSLDRNDDGKISKDEAPQRLSRIWERVDRNADNVLDGDELKSLQKMMAERGANKGEKKKRDGDGKSRPGIKPKRPGGDA